ncbi:uncharacterized protein BDZ83DRAFT_23353 [Colletotrichum acutatum]|uniref:Uncharacterized protein n=1 Tax=Glomerella acutata TaxID=27357 RepID=A0AAD8UG28_GLOAC|nr:uncharacterized protein BDZ83DRAFT_23353 [Colletotrichum acutatum]KAK1718049.1 hypothetical protein BDZ83DRAFT_23353 [Colletotrichum acutatum]
MTSSTILLSSLSIWTRTGEPTCRFDKLGGPREHKGPWKEYQRLPPRSFRIMVTRERERGGPRYNFRVPTEEKQQLWHHGGQPLSCVCMICITSCRGHGSHAQKSATKHSKRRASPTGRSLYHEPQPGFPSCLIVPHRAIRIILRPAQVRPVEKCERLARPVGG